MKRFISWVQNWSADDILWLVFHCMSSTLQANEGGAIVEIGLRLRRCRVTYICVDGAHPSVQLMENGAMLRVVDIDVAPRF